MSYRYDYDLELPVLDIGDVTYCLGTAGSFILVCPTCGAERFRGEPDNPHETCWNGHGRMEAMTLGNRDRFLALWISQGGEVTTVEQRRAGRLEREAAKKEGAPL